MKSKKKYTNLTFTKRVDHEAGHVSTKRISEPAICETCGAVYLRGRWTFDKEALTDDPFDKTELLSTVCPACVQIKEGIPSGFVYITGDFFLERRKEIKNLLRNEAEKMSATNPLARIMKIEKRGKKLVVTTTTEHLAQHLGRAVNKAFGGDVRYDFSHENKLVRVYCVRDE